MTKTELRQKFQRIEINPPEGAGVEELERVYFETVRNMRLTDHPNLVKVTKADLGVADDLITDADSHEQVSVNMGGQ